MRVVLEAVSDTTAKKLDWDEVWRKWKAAQRDIDLFNGADHSFDLDGQRHMIRFIEAPTDRLTDDASCRTLLIEPVLRWLNEHRTF